VILGKHLSDATPKATSEVRDERRLIGGLDEVRSGSVLARCTLHK
jgi:hypothetical protein